jgi:uncharacterized protein (DUF1697 family)
MTTKAAAFLRGVSPSLVKNADLVRAFEAAGFRSVRTVLASGNVVFEGALASAEKRIEAAMQSELGRIFAPIVRSGDELRELIAADPFARFKTPAKAKRVVSFFRKKPQPKIALPAKHENATLHAVEGRHAFTSYVPDPGNPAFMALIERAFGREVTTRTWDTLLKVAKLV